MTYKDGKNHVYDRVNDGKDGKEIYTLTASKKCDKIEFTLIGSRNSYATPTAFVNNGSSTDVKLDENDAQKEGQIVQFNGVSIANAKLSVEDKKGRCSYIS